MDIKKTFINFIDPTLEKTDDSKVKKEIKLFEPKKEIISIITTQALEENGDESPLFITRGLDEEGVTSKGLGEEGGEPIKTTQALGEEGIEFTSKSMGEEGGELIDITSKSIGEEGGEDYITSKSIGEEGGKIEDPVIISKMMGENGEDPIHTTLAVGEEGGFFPIKPPSDEITTMAIGEEGGDTPIKLPVDKIITEQTAQKVIEELISKLGCSDQDIVQKIMDMVGTAQSEEEAIELIRNLINDTLFDYDKATTYAVGEEGGEDGRIIRFPKPIEDTISNFIEEGGGNHTTMAVGEEGGDAIGGRKEVIEDLIKDGVSNFLTEGGTTITQAIGEEGISWYPARLTPGAITDDVIKEIIKQIKELAAGEEEIIPIPEDDTPVNPEDGTAPGNPPAVPEDPDDDITNPPADDDGTEIPDDKPIKHPPPPPKSNREKHQMVIQLVGQEEYNKMKSFLNPHQFQRYIDSQLKKHGIKS